MGFSMFWPTSSFVYMRQDWKVGQKSERACSDILFSLHTLLNFHLLECAFNAFLTNDFWLLCSLGMDVRCRDPRFLLHQNSLSHKILLCVYWTAMLTANVRYQIEFNRKCLILSLYGETRICLIEIIISVFRYWQSMPISYIYFFIFSKLKNYKIHLQITSGHFKYIWFIKINIQVWGSTRTMAIA